MITRRKYTRREFVKRSSAAAAGLLIAAPSVLTAPRARPATERGTLIFQPHFVQSGRGPHLLNWAYASDAKWDAFHSNITASDRGVVISDTEGRAKFGIDVRWNVEGFGYIFLTANNGGEFYELPAAGRERTLNLNYELAKSRITRNNLRAGEFGKEGWKPSREVRSYLDLSNQLLNDAKRVDADEPKRAALSQDALRYALWGSEMMELDHADFSIHRLGRRRDFYAGCDARGMMEMDRDRFLELFTPLFSYAMVTYFVGSHDFHSDIEPRQGDLRFDTRDIAVNSLREHNIRVEGRGIYWFHKWTTPDWLRRMSFNELKCYVEVHTREIISHYPDSMVAWEVMNEFHDWANEVRCTPDQTIELTKLAYDVARDTNPHVKLIINNCCPFAEYVALGEYSDNCIAGYPQRTPWQYTRDCIAAGVDFDVIAQQMYFPYRDLQDIVMNIERLGDFGKPVQLSEIGCPGGPTTDTVKTGRYSWPADPFAWHREWDEELAADWMESIFTLAYSRPFIEGAAWFDFPDPKSYIENGGLLRSPRGEKKAAYVRFGKLMERFRNLPQRKL